MATTPTITDAGALAVKPARVNIFAKPSAPQDQTDPAARQPRGIFDDAAACHSTDEVTDRPPLHPRRRRSPRWRRGAPAARLPRCPGSGGCEPHRRHPVAPGEPRRGRGTGGTGPSPAATTARFPRDEPAILLGSASASNAGSPRQQVASSRAPDRCDPPRAAAAAASPGTQRTARWLRRARLRMSRCPPDRSRPAWRPTRRPSSCERRL